MTSLEEIFLNKKVKVKFQARNDQGKRMAGKFDYMQGICTFIGENKALDIVLQVTIDRTPVTLNHINDIELI